jgi:drug/metabolite transporter (DMT)-like permease
MSMTKTLGLVLLYIATGATGDLLLSHGMKTGQWNWVALGTTSLGIGYGIFLGLLKDVPLSVVVPAGAGSYIIIAILSRLVLHEQVPPGRWVGTVMVSIGVSMVMISEWQNRRSKPEAEMAVEPGEVELVGIHPHVGERLPAGAPSGANG